MLVLDAVLLSIRSTVGLVVYSVSELLPVVSKYKLCREALLTQREDKLWNRMEQLLDREAQMREEERRAARSREQHLQSQLDMVLSMVSKQQTDRSLPPSALASQLLESRASTPQESAHTGPAHQPHGTFDADDSQVDQEVQAALDSVSSTSRSAEPGPANEVHDVINAVLSNQIDPLKDDDFFAQYGAPGVADVADDVSDATSPAPPATPPASSPTSASTASANGGAVPPHVVASLGAAQSALQASASGESGAAPLEHQKASPDGPPPVLSVNDDDICWVGRLHVRICLHSHCHRLCFHRVLFTVEHKRDYSQVYMAL